MLQLLRKLKIKLLIFCVLTLICCKRNGQNLNDLIGVWGGNYNDYSYTMIIGEKGSCRIIQNEVNKTTIDTRVNCESDNCGFSIAGEDYRLIMEQRQSLRILPANVKSKDLRVLCLVQFKRIP
jgi:hypothetical protein